MSKTRIENFIGLSFDFVDIPNSEMPVLNRGPLQAGEITMSQYRSNNIGAKYLLIKQTHVNSRLLAPSPPFLSSLFPPVLNQAFHIFYSIDRDQWRMQDWGDLVKAGVIQKWKFYQYLGSESLLFSMWTRIQGGRGPKIQVKFNKTCIITVFLQISF